MLLNHLITINGGVTGIEPNHERIQDNRINQHQILVTSNTTKPVETNIPITLNKLTLKNSEITPPSLLGIARKIAPMKYHSGLICTGDLILLAGILFSGSDVPPIIIPITTKIKPIPLIASFTQYKG